MDHALLVSFLTGETTPEDFCCRVQEEVNSCAIGIRSANAKGYIIITEGPRFQVGREHIMHLLRCMLDESVPWQTANYAADCLIMSDDFEPEDEAVIEAIHFVADDSRPPTAIETRRALEALN